MPDTPTFTPTGPQLLGPQNLPPTSSAPASFSGGQPAGGGGGVGSPRFNPLGTNAGQSRPGVGVGVGSDTNPMQHSALKAQAAAEQHHSFLGRAAGFLFGHQVDYVPDKDGTMRQVEIKQGPGQLFRSILAGAIMGGAMGADRQRGQQAGFAASFARGAGGVQQQQAQADQERYERAVQQFQMRNEAQKNLTEEQLKQAQIAHLNIATANENFLLHKGVMDQDIAVTEAGKAAMQPFLDAGAQYQFQDVPESKMMDLMKTNPEVAKLFWRPTGWTVGKNDKGDPYVLKTYSAIDPTGGVKLTKGLLAKFNDVGLSDYYPGAKGLKEGQQLNYGSYLALLEKYQLRYNDYMKDIQDKLRNKQYDAETKRAIAEANRLYTEAAKEKLQEKDLSQFKAAQKHFSEVGYDPAELDKRYPGDSAVLAKFAGEMMRDTSTALNAAMKDDPTSETTKELMRQQQVFSGIIAHVFTAPPQTQTAGAANTAPIRNDKVQAAVDEVTGKGGVENGKRFDSDKRLPTDAYRWIEQNDELTAAEKVEALKRAGAVVPWAVVQEQVVRQKGKIADQGAAQGMTPEQIKDAQDAITPDWLADQARNAGLQVEENPARRERRQERTLERGMAASERATNPQAQMPF